MKNDKNSQDSDIKLKDVILFTREYLREVLRKWYVIIGLVAIVFAYYYVNELLEPRNYRATTKYIVNDDSGGSNLGGILGQIGFGKSNSLNLDKVIEISKSRTLIQKSLFYKMIYNGDSTYIGNVIIDMYEIDKIWAKGNPDLLGWRFTNSDPEKFDRQARRAIINIHNKMVSGLGGNPLIVNTYDQGTSILNLSITTRSEQLSLLLSEIIFNDLRNFYDIKTTSKQQSNYDILTLKKDSFEVALKNAEYRLADFLDTNQNALGNRSQLPKARLENEITKYKIVLRQLVEQHEIADFQLRSKKSFFEIVEEPMSPLKRVYMKISTMVKYALIIGLFLSLFMILANMMYQKAMKDEL